MTYAKHLDPEEAKKHGGFLRWKLFDMQIVYQQNVGWYLSFFANFDRKRNMKITVHAISPNNILPCENIFWIHWLKLLLYMVDKDNLWNVTFYKHQKRKVHFFLYNGKVLNQITISLLVCLLKESCRAIVITLVWFVSLCHCYVQMFKPLYLGYTKLSVSFWIFLSIFI